MRTVYILMGGDGCYSDRTESPVMVYESKDEAHSVCDAAMNLVREADAAKRRHPEGSWSNAAHAEWRHWLAPKIEALGLGDAPCEDYDVHECQIKEAPGS